MMTKTSIFDVVKRAEEKLQELREAQEVSSNKHDQFDYGRFKEKLSNDVTFLESIYDDLIGDKNVKEKFAQLVEETAASVFKMLEEADVTPKMITPAVEFASHPLSESEIVEHYRRAFNLILESTFNKKNLAGDLLFEDDGRCIVQRQISPDAVKIVKTCVKTGALDDNDPEIAVKYANAEQSIVDAIRQLFLPRGTMDALTKYQAGIDDGYKDIFGDQFDQNMATFQNGCQKIGTLLAPFIFKRALDQTGANVNFNPVSLAGVSNLDPDNDGDVDIPGSSLDTDNDAE